MAHPDDPQPTIRLTEIDAIPLPTRRASDRLGFAQTVRDHPAWPGRAFTVNFDWNNASEKWVWSVEMEDGPVLVPPTPASYATQYRFEDYILFSFGDLSRRETAVTPDTLGRSVELFALPGPRSPGFDDWLSRQRHVSGEGD